jgi:Transposase DDE domain group 1
MVADTLILADLSPVAGKATVARFDGGKLSAEGGLLALREIEDRLRLADRLADCLKDPRAPERVRHSLADIIRFRMMLIAAGYEDGDDADHLRTDPIFQLALERLPSGADLCSQSTVSRLENLPDRRALLRLAQAFVEQYCASFRQVPRRRVLDADATIPSIACMAVSNCGCSTPSMTITGSSRLTCSTARAAL